MQRCSDKRAFGSCKKSSGINRQYFAFRCYCSAKFQSCVTALNNQRRYRFSLSCKIKASHRSFSCAFDKVRADRGECFSLEYIVKINLRCWRRKRQGERAKGCRIDTRARSFRSIECLNCFYVRILDKLLECTESFSAVFNVPHSLFDRCYCGQNKL